MNYFDRVCAIDISPDIRIDNHKIIFEIKKNIISDKNSCRIDIYNLAENTRNKITSNIDGLVRVNAGYINNNGLVNIGQGNISNIIHLFRSPDIISTVYCKDGFKATKGNIISLSFVEKTPLKSIIDTIIGKLNLPIKITNYDKNALLKGGFSFVGTIPEALDALGKQFNFKWSIQNGQLQILKNGQSTGKQSLFLSAETGLIENPEEILTTKQLSKVVKSTYKVVSLLQPQLEAGDLVQISSKTLSGVFMINELEHRGDTRGNEWLTTMTVIKNG